MSFDHPEILWLALIAPVEIFLVFRRLPRLGKSFREIAGPRQRDSLGSAYAIAAIYGAVSSFLFVLSLVLALAGPAWGSRAVSAERSGLEVSVVLDVSRSMMARESLGSRLQIAKESVRGILRAAPGASFALVAAKGDSILLVPMTDDLEAIDSGLDYADPETLSPVGTDLEKGIETGLAAFTERSGANRILILLSDGGEHGSDALKAAIEARRQHVRIIAIGVGGSEALPVPGPGGSPLLDAKGLTRLSALDPLTLRSVASETGGRYIEAGDPGAKAALQAELTDLGKGGKRTEYEVVERSGLFAILSLIFLLGRYIASILAFSGRKP